MYNDNKDCLVSIGLPTYKCEQRIRRVLNDLLAQDYKNIELIISDDASPDRGFEIINEYARKNSKIEFYRQQKNIGYLRNFELVLKKARGKYFMWAADDDFWEHNFISRLKYILDNNPEYGMAMPSMQQVYEDGYVHKEIIFKDDKDLTNMSNVKVFKAAISKRPPVEFLYYGLWHTDVLKKLVFNDVFNGFLDTIAHDKILMYESSLSIKHYTIPQILWRKTIYRQKYYERYSDSGKKMFLDSKGYFRFVIGAINRLTFSKSIPFLRKTLLPYFIFMIFWSEKKNLLKEFLPRLYLAIHKILKNRQEPSNKE